MQHVIPSASLEALLEIASSMGRNFPRQYSRGKFGHDAFGDL
jgi:hypothetical protein